MSQAVVHTGVNVGMIPLTGQNLPFISSGGTSIITSCLMIGIIQKIIMNSQQAAEARKTVLDYPDCGRKKSLKRSGRTLKPNKNITYC